MKVNLYKFGDIPRNIKGNIGKNTTIYVLNGSFTLGNI